MTSDLPAIPANWKTRMYLLGGVAGLGLGVLAAILCVAVAQAGIEASVVRRR